MRIFVKYSAVNIKVKMEQSSFAENTPENGNL